MPTTVPATTEQVTTSSSYNNVVPVVGYGYSYGKKLLEQAGFTVEISDYEYSYDYPEGYIISQTPEGDTSASTVQLLNLLSQADRFREKQKLLQHRLSSHQIVRTAHRAIQIHSHQAIQTLIITADLSSLTAILHISATHR